MKQPVCKNPNWKLSVIRSMIHLLGNSVDGKALSLDIRLCNNTCRGKKSNFTIIKLLGGHLWCIRNISDVHRGRVSLLLLQIAWAGHKH